MSMFIHIGYWSECMQGALTSLLSAWPAPLGGQPTEVQELFFSGNPIYSALAEKTMMNQAFKLWDPLGACFCCWWREALSKVSTLSVKFTNMACSDSHQLPLLFANHLGMFLLLTKRCMDMGRESISRIEWQCCIYISIWRKVTFLQCGVKSR